MARKHPPRKPTKAKLHAYRSLERTLKKTKQGKQRKAWARLAKRHGSKRVTARRHAFEEATKWEFRKPAGYGIRYTSIGRPDIINRGATDTLYLWRFDEGMTGRGPAKEVIEWLSRERIKGMLIQVRVLPSVGGAASSRLGNATNAEAFLINLENRSSGQTIIGLSHDESISIWWHVQVLVPNTATERFEKKFAEPPKKPRARRAPAKRKRSRKAPPKRVSKAPRKRRKKTKK